MGQYSKKEIEEFQKLVQVLLATGANVHEVEENCKLAKKYSDEIFKLVENGNISTSKTQPQLKPAEAEVKQAVEKKLGRSITVENLDSWVNSLGKPELKGTLPQNMNSVDLIVKFLEEK